MTGWPLVWKTWKCQGIWQLSGKCRGFHSLKVRAMSGKKSCQLFHGWPVMVHDTHTRRGRRRGKSCLKLFIVSCISGSASIQVFSSSLFCVKYIMYGFGSCTVAFLPPTADSNTGMRMIWVTLNMGRSAMEECREPSGNCQGISHCLQSGHPVTSVCAHLCVCVCMHADCCWWKRTWREAVATTMTSWHSWVACRSSWSWQ